MSDAVRFIRFPDLRDRFGITWSRMHVDRLEKLGKFPPRVQLGANTVAWREDEIRDWAKARPAIDRDLPETDEGGELSPPLAPVVLSAPIGIYVISRADGWTKIGITGNPFSRLASLKTSNAQTLTVYLFLRTEKAAEIEKQILNDFRNVRGEGEWLHRPATAVAAAVLQWATLFERKLRSNQPRIPPGSPPISRSALR